MHIRQVSFFISLIIAILGFAVAICWGIALYYDDPVATQKGLLYSWIAMVAIGGGLGLALKKKSMLNRRDGIGIVTFGWISVSLFGALPYMLSGVIPDFVSAFFESMSGFTTTGASVLTGLEDLPRGILFWRSLTHFLGGMGILIMFIAILPFVGTGAVRLYKAESTGLFSERLTPRIADTARIVFGVYLLLNMLCTLALYAGGLSWFDSVCNAFGAIATGGFSTRSNSIAAFNSAYVEWVVIIFMFISGINFILHFMALRGNFEGYRKSSELRLYTFLTICGVLSVTLLVLKNYGNDIPECFRDAAFQTVSLFSTTGFTTTDYDIWPIATKIIFLTLMVIGASAGSTSGAIKSVRIVVVAKAVGRQIKSMIYPSSIQAVKLHHSHVDEQQIDRASSYVIAYIAALVIATILLSLYTPDIMTAVSSVIACLGGVGPGMAAAGPSETYANFPAAAKIILSFCMLLGRLEIYTVLIVLLPSFWKR